MIKRILKMVIKALIMMACVMVGIYLEVKFHDRGLRTVWILIYNLFVPAFVAALLSKYRGKSFEVVGLSLYLGFFGLIAYFVLVGIVWVVHWISGNESLKYFYVIYTILLYIYMPFTLMYGDDAGLGPKTARSTWLYLLEIHLLAKFIFAKPEFQNIFWLIAACLLTLLPSVLGPMRADHLALKDAIYRKKHNISSKCPSCQRAFEVPAYLCPKCGMKHVRLLPDDEGPDGIKCMCGETLPTTFLNGRDRLESLCPYCDMPIKDGGKHVDICIPVVGGPSAGKTCFIHQAIKTIDVKAASAGLEFEYSPTGLDDYEENMTSLNSGHLPDKTNDMRLKYYQFYLNSPDDRVRNLISLCDVGGEVYTDSNAIGEQIGYKYAEAFLMAVDPLSVAKFREEAEKNGVDTTSYGYSAEPIDAVAGMLITTLENMFCISSKEMLNTSVAVVFTKGDIPGLDEKIGPAAVAEYMRTHSEASRFEAQNALCEAFLSECEEYNFLNMLKSKFKTVQFFTASALGHNVNGTAFESHGVEEPVLWLLDKTLPGLGLRKRLD